MVYKFENFEKTGLVRHGFSTRLGGVSTGDYCSMNLGFARGDNKNNVLKNYEIFCGGLGIGINDLVFSAQTHSANVISVTKGDRGNGMITPNKFKDVDGLVTNEKETALVTFHADCAAIYLLDKVKCIIGLSHAGWRGTLNRIAENTVLLMEDKYGTNPSDILAGIGPSIGECCLETEEPVYSLFEKAGFATKSVINAKKGKRNINLWEINKEILINSGVKPDNIEVMGICTKCNGDTFFSHRNMGDKRGSLVAVMELM